MRFSFRFQPLLDWKKNLEELSQLQLAGKMEELRGEEEEIGRIRLQRMEIGRKLSEELIKGIEAGAYLLYRESGEDRLLDLLRKEGEKEATLREIESVREELIGFMKETKMLEKLKEKDLRDFAVQMEKTDQKKIDEMVVMRHSLNSSHWKRGLPRP
jgi:flagellar export protein FliJ